MPTITVSPLSSGKMEPNTLVIESLSIKTPIIYVDQPDEDAFQEGLKSGVVHYPGTADIGQLGNPFIFGHSSDYIWSRGSYKTVFALLPKIKNGDMIIASDAKGNRFLYQVTEIHIVSPDEIKYLDQHNYQKRLLTIQTSYPVGTALKRFIAIAELKSKTP